MSRWINPAPTIKFDNEIPPQDHITYPLYPFDYYTRQIGKKKPSKKSKKDRVLEKSVHLSARIKQKSDK